MTCTNTVNRNSDELFQTRWVKSKIAKHINSDDKIPQAFGKKKSKLHLADE